MKTKYTYLLLAFLALANCKPSTIQYPVTKKVNTVDTYFGTKVADPYRWLENDTSAETAAWVKAQNEVTFGYLEKIPFRNQLKIRLTQLWNYAKCTTPFKVNKYYFFFKNNGLQNQDVLYFQEGVDGSPKLLLDPNKLSSDGTVALSGLGISKDGRYLAYSIARAGSDWNEIFVQEITNGKVLVDHLKWVKFSAIAWYKDGFFYSCYSAPAKGQELSKVNEYHKLYYHKIGTQQTNDKLIFENPEHPKRNVSAFVSDDEQFLFISETESTTGNALLVKNLAKPSSKITRIVEGFNSDFFPIDHFGGYLYFNTNCNAPKYKLVRMPVNAIKKDNFSDVLPEKDQVLESCRFAGGKLVATYIKDAHSVAEVYTPEGKLLREIKLPALGTLEAFNGETKETTCFYSFSSFLIPRSIYKYDIASDSTSVFFKPDIDFDFDKYETRQVFYKSKDGTTVPMYIVCRKDIKLDGTNPTLLYAYGGFNISELPDFSVSRLSWLENGGIYASANIRGGGEYGEEWHRAGTKLNKQNVFDDFIAAAEYLENKKYTSASRLAIYGGSNGGLLIGAVVNQRPDLFAVAFPTVGVMDMLRFHKFTIGWAWVSDYGSSDNEADFKNLYKYSPLHNIKENVNYPAIMVFTADHDDRVVPAHSFKYAATLQEKYHGNKPVLIRIDTKAGHGAGKPTSKRIDEAADRFAFAFYNMGITPSK